MPEAGAAPPEVAVTARRPVVALRPAHDESGRIGATVRATRAIPGVDAVLVIDDASSDGTGALAEAAGADVLRLQRNLGKGGALRAGLERAGDVAVALLLDADLGESAGEAHRILAPVAEGRADMTVAVLPKPPGSGGFGLVLRLARWGIRTSTGWTPRAPLSGQRALNASALRAAGDPAPGFGVEVAMTIRVLRAGLRVAEVDVPMTHAATGRDLKGFSHRAVQFADVARALLSSARALPGGWRRRQ